MNKFKNGDRVKVSSKYTHHDRDQWLDMVVSEVDGTFPYTCKNHNGGVGYFYEDELERVYKFKKGDRVTAGENYGGAWDNLVVDYYDDHSSWPVHATKLDTGSQGAFKESDLEFVVDVVVLPAVWAIDRARELTGGFERTDADFIIKNYKVYDIVIAFAKYIEEHEHPPIDPVVKVCQAVYETPFLSHEATATELKDQLAKVGLEIREIQK